MKEMCEIVRFSDGLFGVRKKAIFGGHEYLQRLPALGSWQFAGLSLGPSKYSSKDDARAALNQYKAWKHDVGTPV